MQELESLKRRTWQEKMIVTQIAIVISSHMLLFWYCDLKSHYQEDKKKDIYQCLSFFTF